MSGIFFLGVLVLSWGMKNIAPELAEFTGSEKVRIKILRVFMCVFIVSTGVSFASNTIEYFQAISKMKDEGKAEEGVLISLVQSTLTRKGMLRIKRTGGGQVVSIVLPLKHRAAPYGVCVNGGFSYLKKKIGFFVRVIRVGAQSGRNASCILQISVGENLNKKV